MSELDAIYAKYELLYRRLKEIVDSSETRVLAMEDNLFSNNVNFFVKSYMTVLCTYLEAFLKEVASACAFESNRRLIAAKVPHNFLYCMLVKNQKENELSFSNACYPLDELLLSDQLSGNPGKTIHFYRTLGVDLTTTEEFVANKDLIGNIVNKRNSIVHRNDNASDISLSDVSAYIDSFLNYMVSVKKAAAAIFIEPYIKE